MNTQRAITEIPTASTRQQKIVAKLKKEFGPVILNALNDPMVTDLHANPDGRVFVDRLDTSETKLIAEISSFARESIIKTVATSLDQVANKENPEIGGELPILGARFQGILPPNATPGPLFSIRIKASKILTLKHYIDTDVITVQIYAMLDKAIENRENILIAGGTGTGKTTFINAFLQHIVQRFPNDRLVICEDVDEIQCSALNKAKIIATENLSLKKVIQATLRLKPGRLIIGEIRSKTQSEAAFQAWNTGHPGGIFSFHANSALDAIRGLEDLNVQAHQDKCQRRITRTVDKILFITKENDQRKVTEFYQLNDFSDGFYNVENLITGQKTTF